MDRDGFGGPSRTIDHDVDVLRMRITDCHPRSVCRDKSLCFGRGSKQNCCREQKPTETVRDPHGLPLSISKMPAAVSAAVGRENGVN